MISILEGLSGSAHLLGLKWEYSSNKKGMIKRQQLGSNRMQQGLNEVGVEPPRKLDSSQALDTIKNHAPLCSLTFSLPDLQKWE